MAVQRYSVGEMVGAYHRWSVVMPVAPGFWRMERGWEDVVVVEVVGWGE